MSWVDEFTDDLAIGVAVWADITNPVNWWNGEAPYTAKVAEEQNAEREGREVSQKRIDDSSKGGLSTIKEAAKETAVQVAEKTKEATNFLGEWGPWILGGVAVLVVGVVVMPYAAAAKELVK